LLGLRRRPWRLQIIVLMSGNYSTKGSSYED
jgi:hypothetical protein